MKEERNKMMGVDYIILEAYDNLAKAIVFQAMKDYRKAYNAYLKNNTRSTRTTLAGLRRFFTSKWYDALFSYDGKFLMEAIEKNAHNKNGMKILQFRM